jgi:hypothetical protein
MSAAEGSTFLVDGLSAQEVRAEKPELPEGAGECFHGSPGPSAIDVGALRRVTGRPIVRRAVEGQLRMSVSGTRVGLWTVW